MKKNNSQENKSEYKQKRAIFRRTAKKSKKMSWNKFTASISTDPPIDQIWKKFVV